jgi:hypothetical protein
MLFVMILFGILVFGLILLAAGALLLLKVDNKLPGFLALGFGLLFTASPIFVLLTLTIVQSSSG